MIEFTSVQGHRIEFERIGHGDPVMVFLHEGLGSISMWRDFPEKCARACGSSALVYSRYGYGQSDPLKDARRPDYMHEEALTTLPELLGKLGIEQPILFGHSDGASIALLYAAAYPVRAVVVLAPHVFVEEVAIEGIRAIRRQYETNALREKMARYHKDPDSAFYGWNDIWLEPAFRRWSIEDVLARIESPILVVQGFEDEYGTMEQVDRIARQAPHVQTRKLEKCGHSPQRDRPQAVIGAAVDFLAGIDTPNGRETPTSSKH